MDPLEIQGGRDDLRGRPAFKPGALRTDYATSPRPPSSTPPACLVSPELPNMAWLCQAFWTDPVLRKSMMDMHVVQGLQSTRPGAPAVGFSSTAAMVSRQSLREPSSGKPMQSLFLLFFVASSTYCQVRRFRTPSLLHHVLCPLNIGPRQLRWMGAAKTKAKTCPRFGTSWLPRAFV